MLSQQIFSPCSLREGEYLHLILCRLLLSGRTQFYTSKSLPNLKYFKLNTLIITKFPKFSTNVFTPSLLPSNRWKRRRLNTFFCAMPQNKSDIVHCRLRENIPFALRTKVPFSHRLSLAISTPDTIISTPELSHLGNIGISWKHSWNYRVYSSSK